MARITQGNRLYLYDLLRREVGIGKQTMLQRVEEVFAADDLMPSDMECSTVREVLEQLNEFVRLTIFKKGRVYATVLSQPEWDELLEQAERAQGDKPSATGPASGGGKGGPKSWKRKKANKVLRPAKPRPRGRAVAEPSQAEEPGTPTKPEATVSPEPMDKPEALQTPKTTAEQVGTPQDVQENVAEQVVSQQDAPKAMTEQVGAQEPTVAYEAKPTAAPVAKAKEEPAVPIASEQQTPEPKKPSQAERRTKSEPEALQKEAQAPKPEAKPRPTTAPEPIATDNPWADLPCHLGEEVHCDNATLASLYRILPMDVDPLALVDEDWRVARSTNSFIGDRRCVEFDLRCICTSNDAPVRMSLRRTVMPGGYRWALELATSASDLADARLEGLPHVGEGMWRDLDFVYDTIRSYGLVDPLRELAQFAVLGPWDELLQQLADLAEPESWDSDLTGLREYLSLTFVRILREDKLVTWDEGQRAAFDTGLISADAHRVLMTFVARTGDIPWQFAGFTTSDCDASADADVDAEPPTYVSSLANVTFAAPYDVRIPKRLVHAYGPGLAPAIEHACCRARRNYRVATPAYDPQTNSMRLLLPLVLNEGETRALVLAPHEDCGYEARAVMTPSRARACARVVSAELPRWMD